MRSGTTDRCASGLRCATSGRALLRSARSTVAHTPAAPARTHTHSQSSYGSEYSPGSGSARPTAAVPAASRRHRGRRQRPAAAAAWADPAVPAADATAEPARLRSSICLLACWFPYWFACSFVSLFVCVFVCLLVCLFAGICPVVVCLFVCRNLPCGCLFVCWELQVFTHACGGAAREGKRAAALELAYTTLGVAHWYR